MDIFVRSSLPSIHTDDISWSLCSSTIIVNTNMQLSNRIQDNFVM